MMSVKIIIGMVVALGVAGCNQTNGAGVNAAAGQPILRVSDSETFPGCKIFRTPANRSFFAQGHIIRAGGTCPTTWSDGKPMMNGTLISRNQIKLANGATCTFGEDSFGTCA